MDRKKILAGVTLLSLCVMGGCAKEPVLTVGSKNFTEQVLLSEIIAQHLERRLGRKVDRKLNLGGTLLVHSALQNHEIDLYPEYTGTALTAILKDPVETNPSIVYERVRLEYQRMMLGEWLKPLGFNNSFVMVVRGDDARSRKLETISDAAKVARYWKLGTGYEFSERKDGFPALTAGYSINWAAPIKTMDLGLLYKALQDNQVNMIAANATDGMLTTLDVKVLKDDQSVFPPYDACVVVRSDSLAMYPGLRDALTALSGKFTNEMMQKLNYEVDGRHRSVREVAADFLAHAGL